MRRYPLALGVVLLGVVMIVAGFVAEVGAGVCDQCDPSDSWGPGVVIAGVLVVAGGIGLAIWTFVRGRRDG